MRGDKIDGSFGILIHIRVPAGGHAHDGIMRCCCCFRRRRRSRWRCNGIVIHDDPAAHALAELPGARVDQPEADADVGGRGTEPWDNGAEVRG